MIDVKETLLDSLIYKAKKIAEYRGTKQLLTITKKIAPIHLLSFFDEVKQLNKNRTFWADVQRDFYIVGIGQVKRLTADESRYKNLQAKWQTFSEKALIHNEYDQLGTGLIALGGMSFDPLNKRTELWENFPTSELVVPEISIVKQKHNYYLTFNIYVNENDDVQEKVRQIEREEKLLFQYRLQVIKSSSSIMKKEEVNREQWIDSVIQARDKVRADKVKKIVMAREMKVTLNEKANLSVIINNLIQTQPNSYVFAFEKGADCFVGASPERLVRIENEHVLSTCLAGTAPRGQDVESDEQIKSNLFNDHKNREEHDYVVQMIRNSIDSYCEKLNIPDEPIVISLKDLHHLYTPVTAVLKEGTTIFDFIKQLHPTPALGGEPKKESLAFIRKNEQMDRGWYGAPIGWLDHSLNGEFAVAIRSGLVKKDCISLFAGCGIMKDSDPQLEYEETSVKFLPMLNALEADDESY